MAKIEFGSSLRDRPKMSCGEGVRTLVIASVGTSRSADSLDDEIVKVAQAAHVGADVVTDHSFYGDIHRFHRRIADEVDVGLSAVACYEFAAKFENSAWAGVNGLDAIDMFEELLSRGLDLVTVHASLSKSDIEQTRDSRRTIPTTSKGGGIISSYVRATGAENPYLEHFDKILEILKSYGAGLSLGTTFRSATVVDHWDGPMSAELKAMGDLVRRAEFAGVPVMVEGLGHASIGAIPTYVRLAKAYCHGAPYRVLPMATDRALGYDHISGAIATATAVAGGADAVTAMSRAEHIGLPTSDDMAEGLIATKVAAAAGELEKLGRYDLELQMSRTRWAQGCKGDWTAAIHPAGAEAALKERGRLGDQLIQCGMCGDFCGIASGIATVKLSKSKPRSHN